MTDSLSSYYRELSKCKILDNEELNRLIVKAQQGDSRAIDTIVKSNLRFVVSLAKNFQVKGMDIEDLISSGNEGLLTAIKKFDPTRNVPFTSYAAFWIKQSMYYLIYYNRDSIRLPLTQRVKAKVVNDCIKHNGYTPSTHEIATILGYKEATVDMLLKFGVRPRSLDETVCEDGSQLQDLIPSSYNLEEEVNNRLINEMLEKASAILSNREKDIVNLLIGKFGLTLTLQEVADLYGVSKERIRQVRDRALNRLKEKFLYLTHDMSR